MNSVRMVIVAIWAMAFSLVGRSAAAEYPSPQAAGFHHCALIYDKAVRGVKELMPFVAREEGGKSKEWLFDAFLLLHYSAPRGMDTLTGATIRSDWEHQLDRWFSPGRDLAALDSAVSAAARALGEPPSKREVMFAIPYMNPSVRDFGDVDGDGKGEDLSTAAGREMALRWYIGEARRRFEAARYKHLHLWGFYWMREDMPAGDEPMVRQAASVIHGTGGKLLWIPYFQAAGWERWRAVGIDVALMQSVYAFTFAHHGDIRRNRLAVTATLARGKGLGAEIECGDIAREPKDRYYFRCYLADGAVDRLGYQQAATAYYLGDDLVEQMLASPKPEVRALYDALADYVVGRKVPDPDPPISWTASPGAAPLTNDFLTEGRAVRTAETRFAAPTGVGRLDVFLDEPDPREVWTGSAQVEVMRPGESAWSPGGWTVRTGGDPGAGRWQVMSAPVGQTVLGLRVRFRGLEGEGAPPLVRGIKPEIAAADSTLHVSLHRAQYRPYRFLPAPAATYPDRGHMLTDGVVADRNFLGGQSVGWLWADAGIHFDLGRVRMVSSIEVDCQGGGLGAVNWPASAIAMLSTVDPPPMMLSASGRLPADIRWVLPEPLVIDSRRAADDMNGHLTFTLDRPARTRFVSIVLKPNSWVMVSEVKVFAEGENVAPKAKYRLWPPPSPNADPKPYADDGRRLTDGVIAEDFTGSAVTGWDTDEPRQVVIDLGYAQPVRTVTAWSMYGGKGSVYAPASAEVEVSTDGETWKPLGTATRPDVLEDGQACKALPYRVTAPAAVDARYVRVTVKRAQGWAMLSEVTVE